jgi:hypothetical protein
MVGMRGFLFPMVGLERVTYMVLMILQCVSSLYVLSVLVTCI